MTVWFCVAMSFFEAITSKILEDQFDKGTDTIQSWQPRWKKETTCTKKNIYASPTILLVRSFCKFKVGTEKLSGIGLNYFFLSYFDVVSSPNTLRNTNVIKGLAALMTKKKAAL